MSRKKSKHSSNEDEIPKALRNMKKDLEVR